MAGAALAASIPSAMIYANYYTTDSPRAHLRENGYRDISFGAPAPDSCGKAYPNAHAFNATARNGERVSGVYCASRNLTFGFVIKRGDTALAAVSPP